MENDPSPLSGSPEEPEEILEGKFDLEENPDYTIKWDGSDTEIVSDNTVEHYEDEVTGFKFKYILEESEILDFLKRSENFSKNLKLQIKHTVVQGALFVFLLILGIIFKNSYFMILCLAPIITTALFWFLPALNIKKVAKKFCDGKEISVKVFPDGIEVASEGVTKEIPLDNTFDSEKCAGNILIFSKSAGISVLIPLRAIEPEFLAEVQAIIFSGVNSINKN